VSCRPLLSVVVLLLLFALSPVQAEETDSASSPSVAQAGQNSGAQNSDAAKSGASGQLDGLPSPFERRPREPRDSAPHDQHGHDQHGHDHHSHDDTGDSGQEGHAGSSRSFWILTLYCGLIVLASLAGGWLPFLVNLTHTRMQVMVSLVAGLMLGVGLFHMLPHAYGEIAGHSPAGALDRAVWWMMVGLLTMFFLIRAFHFHQHGAAGLPEVTEQGEHTTPACAHDHDHDHDHGHHHHHSHQGSHGHHHGHSHQLSWVGVTFGLALHTMIDGIALAASVQAESLHHADSWLIGVGTFVAILLHKPLDAVSITSLMTAGGWSSPWRHTVNAGFAMMCPLGALLFYTGLSQLDAGQGLMVGCALAFSAGVFLCISLGDLLPEVEFHSHDRIKLSVALLCGIALAYGIGFLEPAHAHQHGPGGHVHGEHVHDHGHQH